MEQPTILHPPSLDMVSDLTTNLWVKNKKEGKGTAPRLFQGHVVRYSQNLRNSYSQHENAKDAAFNSQ